MSENNTANASVNAKMGLVGWLTLLFVILKLDPGSYLTSPVVDWSWWLVFAPILIVWGFSLVVLAVLGIGFLGAYVFDKVGQHTRKKSAKNFSNMTPEDRREYLRRNRKR